jgi:hypothetical protein
MRVSKRQLLRIIREEAAAADDAAETESTDTDDADETSSTEDDDAPVSVSEARLRRRVRRALRNQILKESRGAGLFGAIGFEGLGQTNRANHARPYHGTYATTKKNRVVKEAAPTGGDPKDILYNVVLPALAEAGFSGLEGFKMVRKVAEAMDADVKAMLGS